MPKKSNADLYEEAERELYGQAIRQTDQEIFDDVLARDPDENDGDNELEQMDEDDAPTGDEEPTEEEEGEEPDEPEEGEAEGEEGEGEEPEPEPQDRGQDRRGIPPGRLREESEARRAAEAERETLRAQLGEVAARLQLLERGNQPKPQQPERPDMFADPEGWARAQRAEIEASVAARHVNASLTDAREEHGEKFDAAYRALIRSGQAGDRQTVQQIWDSPNPGRALMRWHMQQQVLSEIRSTPGGLDALIERKLQERMRDPEQRRQYLEDMRNEAMNGDGGRPRTRTRLPASLNGASGGQGHRSRDPGPTRGGGFSASAEREIADSVWEN